MNITKIKDWTKAQNLSQGGLARLLGVSPTAVMKVFRHGGSFNREHFAKLVEISEGKISWDDYAPQDTTTSQE